VEGLVFCVDSAPSPWVGFGKKPVAGGQESESALYALDARTGREIWSKQITYKQPRRSGRTTMTGGGRTKTTGWLARRRTARSWPADTHWQTPGGEDRQAALGEQGDQREAGGHRARNTLIDQGQGGPVRACVTGQHLRPSDGRKGGGVRRVGRELSAHARWPSCGALPEQTVSYVAMDEQKKYHLRSARSGCVGNAIPADGLLNVPNFVADCVCNVPIQTSFALVYMPEAAAWRAPYR